MFGQAVSCGEKAWVSLVGQAPLVAYSRAVRAAAEMVLPECLREAVLARMVASLGIEMREAEHELTAYRSFAELFSRRLKPGARPLDPDESAVVSPADGLLSQVGVVSQGRLLQAKGLDYDLQELVVDPDLARALEGGPSLTVYLRPRDYHRVHSPVAATVSQVIRVPGKLLPVQPAFVRRRLNLFVQNERVVLDLTSTLGRMALVCVGAAAVGLMTTVFDDLAPNALPTPVERGQELAAFNLGSTVILIAEANRIEPLPLAPPCEVRMGQRLACRLG